MTLPSSFPLSVSQINVELGRASGAAFSISGAAERALAGKPSGAISFSDFLGKSNGPSVEYLGYVSTTTAFATATAASFPLGAAVAGRRIFILVHWFEPDPHKFLTDATIRGVSATIHLHKGHSGGGTGFGVAIISAAVPSGTSGDVVLTFGSNLSSSGVQISGFAATNLTNSSPSDTASQERSGTAGNLSTSINVPEGGFVIAAFSSSTGASGDAVSWVGVTEEYDTAAGGRNSAAYSQAMSAQTGRTIGVNAATRSDAGNAFVAVSWV